MGLPTGRHISYVAHFVDRFLHQSVFVTISSIPVLQSNVPTPPARLIGCVTTLQNRSIVCQITVPTSSLLLHGSSWVGCPSVKWDRVPPHPSSLSAPIASISDVAPDQSASTAGSPNLLSSPLPPPPRLPITLGCISSRTKSEFFGEHECLSESINHCNGQFLLRGSLYDYLLYLQSTLDVT